MASIEDSVVVEYGADIHVAEMGSGFPTASTKDALPDCEVIRLKAVYVDKLAYFVWKPVFKFCERRFEDYVCLSCSNI